uniref:Protein transport protein sec16 n=1 Tax=Parastrongyloides trichosuri TaxID=131310 RepID=A0A0N4ZYR0_PARTI
MNSERHSRMRRRSKQPLGNSLFSTDYSIPEYGQYNNSVENEYIQCPNENYINYNHSIGHSYNELCNSSFHEAPSLMYPFGRVKSISNSKHYNKNSLYNSTLSKKHGKGQQIHSVTNQNRILTHHTNDDYYFFGVIQLSHDKVSSILNLNPPPEEYFKLTSIEKAAYLFYFNLYKKHIKNINKFHILFNKEFYNYTSQGISNECALKKICDHTKYEYEAKVKKILIENDDEMAINNNLSTIAKQCIEEPYLYKYSHAIGKFCYVGKFLSMNPLNSENHIVIQDVNDVLIDYENRKLYECLYDFRGPLTTEKTMKHSIKLFIHKQIKKIESSERYLKDPNCPEMNDCILIWKLLEALIQQNGNISGPDMARLLLENKKIYKNCITIETKNNENYSTSLEAFTKLLLGGHVEEAIDLAIDHNLYAEALIIARKIQPNNYELIEKIESASIMRKEITNPLSTLYSVSSDKPVPILVELNDENIYLWRTHVSIILSNLSSPAANEAIYNFGQVLNRKGFKCAADFCFLSLNLLSGFYHFNEIDGNNSSDIRFIHGSVNNDEPTFNGISVINFQATEIFEYGVKLGGQGLQNCLTQSNAYQLYKMNYALLLSRYNRFRQYSMNYCIEIVKNIKDKINDFNIQNIDMLIDIMDHLHVFYEDKDNVEILIGTIKDEQKKRKDNCTNNIKLTEESYENQKNIEHLISNSKEKYVNKSTFSKKSSKTKNNPFNLEHAPEDLIKV